MSAVTEEKNEYWAEAIEPGTKLLNVRFRELWHYHGLVLMFVRRDFVANYKYTAVISHLIKLNLYHGV